MHGKSFIPVCEKVSEGKSPAPLVVESQDQAVPPLRIAVVGSAGRKDDASKFTKDVYVDAFGSIVSVVHDFLKVSPSTKIELVSGGAAYADHLAVQFYLVQFLPCSLTLYLPTKFEGKQYYDTGVVDFSRNPGGTLNHYHRQFSNNLNLDSLNEVKMAIDRGAKVVTGGGLYGRNTKIAENSDIVVALTFGDRERLKSGGTMDTCRKFLRKNPKEALYHIDLHNPKVVHWPGIC